ncbi:hypothetical protein AM228_15170 [Planktothricoides sp. SR001]|nr:hypothetical protein AM228_15170 [Planktothricoides sp. SR001]
MLIFFFNIYHTCYPKIRQGWCYKLLIWEKTGLIDALSGSAKNRVFVDNAKIICYSYNKPGL